MRTNFWATRAIAALALLGAFSGAAQAEDADPPGRAARLGQLQGSVSLEPAGVTEWTAAVSNRPLTTGDRLWSDLDSRAELDMGALVARLGSSTGFALLNLDNGAAQMQLTAGTLIVRVRDPGATENIEVDTPNLAITLQQPGEYRIEVNDAGDTTVLKVVEGEAQASGNGQAVQVGAQQRYTFSGTGELSIEAGTLAAPDELDAWSAARERQLEDSPSRDYVAADLVGTQDLDENGQWQQSAEYGYVWTPTTVAVGWAPYRFGQWAWISPWGWTWVDDARWGYAPFHYGRWVSWNNAWCWVPGPRNVRPVYAPALVGWVSGPGGAGLTAAGSSVGWFPLGPREVYVPAYRVSPGYVRRVNLTNTTVINTTTILNVYNGTPGNAHYVNNTSTAVTAVPTAVFTSGQRLAGHTQHLAPALLTGAVTLAQAPAIVPSRASVLGPAPPRPVARPPLAVMNRPVLARTALPPAPVPFERQVGAMQANGGRPLEAAERARLQPPAAAVPVRMVAPPPAARSDAGTLAVPLQPRTTAPVLSAAPTAPQGYAGRPAVLTPTAPAYASPAATLRTAPVQGVPDAGHPQAPPPSVRTVTAPAVQGGVPAPAREYAPAAVPRPAPVHAAPAATAPPRPAPPAQAHEAPGKR